MRTFKTLAPLLTAALFWSISAVQAQTYFYLEGIAVVPVEPTDQDDVQLQLSGNLSDSGASITSATAQVTGSTVTLTLAATSVGGLDVLVPHTEAVDVGILPAGNYTITITGSGTQDFAPQDDHHFTVTGSASACDSVVLASLSWAPFSDTALLVHVFNPTATLFDYPGFILLADNGDTLAQETVNFFGIGQESYHTLGIHPGSNMPTSPFNGNLQLWTGFYDTLACSWDLSADLCPPDSCTEVIVDMQNFGSGLATGSFLYTVREGGSTVATGTLVLTAQQQYVQDTVCLPPGNYLMEIVPEQGPTDGQPTFGVGMGYSVPGPHAPVIWTTLSAVAFTLYGPCIDIDQGIKEDAPSTLQLVRSVAGVEVYRTDSRALGSIQVFDAQGRILSVAVEEGPRHFFSTADWAPGLYVVRIRNADGQVLTARWITE